MLMTRWEMDQLETEALQLLKAYQQEEHTSLLAEVDQRSQQGSLSASTLGLAAASLVAMERFEEAATAVRGALQQEPRWAWLYRTLGLAEAGRGEWGQAVEAAQMATQLKPDVPEYLSTYAYCLRLANKPEEALKAARQALSVEPMNEDALNQAGLALEATGLPEAALDEYRLAQQTWPKSPAAYLNEGRLHQRSGRVKEARQTYQQALRLSPGLMEAEDQLASTFISRPPFHQVMMHLLTLSRLTVTGWAIIAFLYYLLFRLMEYLWRLSAMMLPVGRVLLIATLIWLVGGALVGWGLRLFLRRAPGPT